jgi:hypothetical protein
MRAEGEQVVLVIPHTQTQIARIAQGTGLSDIFALYESTEAALAMLHRAAGVQGGLVSTEPAEAMHDVHVRDLRARFGDVEAYVARCSCGWASATGTGRFGERSAQA